MKTYKDFLFEVKTKNPDLPHKVAQKLASDLHKEYVNAGKATGVVSTEPTNVVLAHQIEGFIREPGKVVDINRISEGMNTHGVKDYVIEDAGADGVNRKKYVTAPGLRVPYEGFFIVFQ
jgi:hypothetical protein